MAKASINMFMINDRDVTLIVIAGYFGQLSPQFNNFQWRGENRQKKHFTCRYSEACIF